MPPTGPAALGLGQGGPERARAAAGRRRLGRQAEVWLHGGGEDPAATKAAQAAFQAPSPLEGELVLEGGALGPPGFPRPLPGLRPREPLRILSQAPRARSPPDLRHRGRRGHVPRDLRRHPGCGEYLQKHRSSIMTETKGWVTGVNGNMVGVRVEGPVSMNEVAFILVGGKRLKSEVIRLKGEGAQVQVFRDHPGDQGRRQGRIHRGPPLRGARARSPRADLRRPAEPPAPGRRQDGQFPRARDLPRSPRPGQGLALHPQGQARRHAQGRGLPGDRPRGSFRPPHHASLRFGRGLEARQRQACGGPISSTR